MPSQSSILMEKPIRLIFFRTKPRTTGVDLVQRQADWTNIALVTIVTSCVVCAVTFNPVLA